MDDIQLYVNPVNCLIYDPNEQNKPCELKLIIPGHFELACGAPHENHDYTKRNSFHESIHSPFSVSASMQHDTYTVHGKTFHLWFQGAVELNWDKLKAYFRKVYRLSNRTFSAVDQ